jgi:hypothetical protein
MKKKSIFWAAVHRYKLRGFSEKDSIEKVTEKKKRNKLMEKYNHGN